MSETTKKPIKGIVHINDSQHEVELRFLTSYKGGVESTNLHIIIPDLEHTVINGIVINHNNLLLLKEELNELPN